MREIGAFEAKTHLSELLAAAEGGESVFITRRSAPVARLVPAAGVRDRTPAVARMAALRAKLAVPGVRLDAAEILSAQRRPAVSLVVDASALIGWAMPDNSGLDLDGALIRHEEVLAPWLLWVELRNILPVSERRGRLLAGMTKQLAGAYDALAVTLDTAPEGGALGLQAEGATRGNQQRTGCGRATGAVPIADRRGSAGRG